MIEVPYLDHDVHDLAGLIEVDRYLFAGQRGSGRDRGPQPRPGREQAEATGRWAR